MSTLHVGKNKRCRRLLWISVALLLILSGASLLLPRLGKAREPVNRLKCELNLRQIGLSVSQYAQEHAGQYPDSLLTLARDAALTPSAFVCPSSEDEPAGGLTPAEVIVNMAKPRHVSYVYLGKGMTTKTVKEDMLLVYEPSENHLNEGMNMLFGDGHAEWEPLANANKLIAKAAPATQP